MTSKLTLKGLVQYLKREFKKETGKTAFLKSDKDKIIVQLPDLWLGHVEDYRCYLKLLCRVISDRPDLERYITEELLLKTPKNMEGDPEACWYHGYLTRTCEDNYDVKLIMDFTEEEAEEDDEDDDDGDEDEYE